jgi:hypothetical protein
MYSRSRRIRLQVDINNLENILLKLTGAMHQRRVSWDGGIIEDSLTVAEKREGVSGN